MGRPPPGARQRAAFEAEVDAQSEPSAPSASRGIPPEREASSLLEAVVRGEDKAADRLAPLVYDELRELACPSLRAPSSHAPQPAVPVREAYIKLAEPGASDPRGHTHFRAIGAVAMRQVLIDQARAGSLQKRGGDRQRVTLVAGIGGETDAVESLLVPPTASRWVPLTG